MVEEAASASEATVTVAEQTLASSAKEGETLGAAQGSIEATIESAAQGGTESTCNDGSNHSNSINNAAESAAPDDVPDEEREKTLEFAEELAERGSTALKENDFSEAADCFSRALEIRVAQHGELALECMNAYYQYGRALLYKAQDEADPLGNMPRKEGEPQQESGKNGSAKNAVNGESSTASVSSKAEQEGSSSRQEEDSHGKDQGEEDDDDDDDDEDLADADEDESDLDLAWKMLDIARAIADKSSGDTMEKVDILSALAEVSLEREDIESSLSDYQKALSILDRLVEPDSRHIAELNFRICLCLEIGSKPQEAIPYCQKAIAICKARIDRLTNEVKSTTASATSSTVSEVDEGMQQSSNVSCSDKLAPDKEAEVQTLSGLAVELEKKLEDLQQHAVNPKSILSEILGMASVKAKGSDKGVTSAGMSSSQMGNVNGSQYLESPTVSTAHTNNNGASGVTNLGVVGRGVKRVLMTPTSEESSPMKKPAPDKADGNAS